jgi:hypothetical protein
MRAQGNKRGSNIMELAQDIECKSNDNVRKKLFCAYKN